MNDESVSDLEPRWWLVARMRREIAADPQGFVTRRMRAVIERVGRELDRERSDSDEHAGRDGPAGHEREPGRGPAEVQYLPPTDWTPGGDGPG